MKPLSLDLTPELSDPGFTPGAAHLERLLALLAEASREDAPRVERVLSRGGTAALDAVLAHFDAAPPEVQARLANVLARLADPRAAETLRRAVAGPDARLARRAANALGKLEPEPETDRALRRAFENGDALLRRAAAEALGKVGDPDAVRLFDAADASDPELARIVQKARLLLERRQHRATSSAIELDAPLGEKLTVIARARAGLAEILAGELAPRGPARAVAEGLVELPFAGSLRELLAARTALDFGLKLALPPHRPSDLAEAVGRALASERAALVFRRWTRGLVRFRVSFSAGGHRRALVFRIAEAVQRAVPELVNDPRAPSWEIVVVERGPEPYLVLVPLAFDDPRFTYRKREVRAASHPTLAAALALTAGGRPDDVVWDPFVGSALELVERGRLGPHRALIGSDLDPTALDAARVNLDAAGLAAELREGDATRLTPPGVTLVITNPPMGRRLLRDRTLVTLLDAFVPHAASVLLRGGRLVWLSPLPERTRRAAAAAGLELVSGRVVDMGGFEAELQTLRKR